MASVAAPLLGKVALVTGSGSGIGRASALALARAGASLVLTGRREAPLVDTAAMIAQDGGAPALVCPTDLCDPAAVDALFSKVESEKGRLDGACASPAAPSTPSAHFHTARCICA